MMKEMTVWVPAVPLPFFGFWRNRCIACNRKFRKQEAYERHYVEEHIVTKQFLTVECFVELPVSRAIDMGYGPWLVRKQQYERQQQMRIERRDQRRSDRHEPV